MVVTGSIPPDVENIRQEYSMLSLTNSLFICMFILLFCTMITSWQGGREMTRGKGIKHPNKSTPFVDPASKNCQLTHQDRYYP